MSEAELGRTVLLVARSAIAARLGLSAPEPANHATLRQRCATFVTLRHAGELRGCIGSVQAFRPLAEDVRANAIAAAFHDPRFAPLAAAELAATTIEVSLLSASERIEAAHEEELLARVRPGVDGLILEWGRRRATLLPQVWEQLADPHEFLAALKRKAGLSEDFWSAAVSVSRYEVTTWKEEDLAPAGLRH